MTALPPTRPPLLQRLLRQQRWLGRLGESALIGGQAVAAIAGFGEAAALAQQSLAQETARLTALRQRLAQQLEAMPSLQLTGDPQQQAGHRF